MCQYYNGNDIILRYHKDWVKSIIIIYWIILFELFLNVFYSLSKII